MKFKVVSLIFLGTLILMSILNSIIPFNGMLYALPIMCYLAIVAYGSFQIKMNFFLTAINHGKTKEKVVALTFDDGPHSERTAQVLDILKKEKVKATFFCIGKNIPSNESLLQRMQAEGHLIGNHSYTHGNFFDFLSASKMIEELEKTGNLIASITGKPSNLFRPPYGVTNPNLAKAVRKTGLRTIGWNIRSLDTVSKNERELCERIRSRLQAGSIILLHDNQDVTVHALALIIKTIRKSGYEIVDLEELIAMN